MEKRLPVGIQDFEKIRKGGYIYVDKTNYIHRLINGSGASFFLSRPRRFGKSLFLSTMEALFKGQKDLFNDLYIYDKTDWNESYPVIKLDWTKIGYNTQKQLEINMINTLKQIGKSYQIDLETNENAAETFKNLIYYLHEKTGQRAVVLIDEYDAPILDNLNKPDEVIEPIREFMHNFYRILKACDQYLKFVFLTGISKFAKISVFSGLNNLVDISIDEEYAAICGLTQEEIETNFGSHIEIMAKDYETTRQEILDTMKYWYNGFSWDGNVFVYNPFSTLLLFSKKTFDNHWFATATPTFLIDIIKKRNDINYLLAPFEVNAASFDAFDYKTLSTVSLLFQTGYLTIKSVKKGRIGVPPEYTLDIPNNEVRNSLLEWLVSSYASYPLIDTSILRDQMLKQLLSKDEPAFEKSVKKLFAGIPYQLHIPREAYYHSLLLLWLNMLGFEVQGEVSTDKGRIDAVLLLKDHVVITEIKYSNEGNTDQLIQDAFSQIHETGYYERYNSSNQKVILLAIGLAGKEISCKMKSLN